MNERRSERAANAQRGLRVLVIDDDEMITTVLANQLSAHHDVTIENDSRAALARLRGGARYDVVVSDLMMPSVSGFELVRQLQQIAPELARRTVFMTGGAVSREICDALAATTVPTIAKPFDFDELLAVIDTVTRVLD